MKVPTSGRLGRSATLSNALNTPRGINLETRILIVTAAMDTAFRRKQQDLFKIRARLVK
jgi:hypothetical protein